MRQHMPIFTNQRGALRWRIAETGITPEALLAATRDDPILVTGSTIDVTRDYSRILVHFCRSNWKADGFTRERAENYDDLKRFSIEFLCPVPAYGQRYSVNGEFYFNGWRPVLAITSFTHLRKIPKSTRFLLNDVHMADRTTLPIDVPHTNTPHLRLRRSFVTA